MSDLGGVLLSQLDADDVAALRGLLGLLDNRQPPDETRRPLLTSAEAAQHAGCCVETLRRHVREGSLTAKRVGRSLRIDPLDLDRWLNGPSPHERPAARPRVGTQRTSGRPLAEALARL